MARRSSANPPQAIGRNRCRLFGTGAGTPYRCRSAGQGRGAPPGGQLLHIRGAQRADGVRRDDVDQTLLQRVAGGEAAAVEECIDRYGGLIWSLARKLIGAHADAEDGVQEVFIDLWKSAGRFDPNVASEPTFVAMIARRRLIDSRRRRHRRPDQGPSMRVEDVDMPSGEQERDAVELAEEASQAAAAIRELRPEQQEILRLSVYEGWSHQRVADHLQVPLGTVKTHVRRGLIRVRELIEGRSPNMVNPQVTP